MSKKLFNPKSMTLKIHYGNGHRFSNAKELLEFLEDDWSIASHDDVFEERDRVKKKLRYYQEFLERNDPFNECEDFMEGARE